MSSHRLKTRVRFAFRKQITHPFGVMTHFKKFTLEISLLQKWRLPTPPSIDFDRFRSISIDFDRFRSNKKNKQKKQEKGGPKARGAEIDRFRSKQTKKTRKRGDRRLGGSRARFEPQPPRRHFFRREIFMGFSFLKCVMTPNG